MKRRADFGTAPDAFFDSLGGDIAMLARDLRDVIRRGVPHASESIKWGMPVYEQDGLICAIRCSRDHVALQFYTSGTELSDPDGLLEGTGKRMRHVKIRSKRDIKRRVLTLWLKQAASRS